MTGVASSGVAVKLEGWGIGILIAVAWLVVLMAAVEGWKRVRRWRERRRRG